MNFLLLYYIYASLDKDMDHSHVSYKYHTMLFLLAMGLAPLLLYIALINIVHTCWTIFCVMIRYATVHTCRWWEWKIPCIMSWLLAVMAHYWSYALSKSSSSSSSTSISTSISAWCVALRYLVILRKIILWMCIIILQLQIVVLLVHIIVWWWYLVELRCKLFCHHLFLHPISI
jgi:hypothetical protein